MNSMKHKGYTAKIEFDDQDEIFVGRVIGLNDIVTFHGETVGELRSSFSEAIEGYLSVCKKIGKKPEKEYSGNLTLRVPPEVHSYAAWASELEGMSLNAWAEKALASAAHQVIDPAIGVETEVPRKRAYA